MNELKRGWLSRGWWRERIVADLPASFVVFLVALPLSMGIAIASGAPVTAGLVTAIVGGLVTGVLAGAPLQVSGPAAGLSVVVYDCIQKHGIEALGVVVLLAGGFQVLAGALRMGQWFRAVSPAVIQGMLAGIGVLILGSQFHVMVDDKPKEDGLRNLVTIPQAIAKAFPWPFERSEWTDRSARARLLRDAGALHLDQTKIGEAVHHQLGGLNFEEFPEDITADEAYFESENSANKPSDAQVAAAAQLRQLADAQRRILDRLTEAEGMKAAASIRLARQAVREALSDLEAGNVASARQSQDRAARAIGDLRDSLKSHQFAAGLGMLTIIILVFWQATMARRWRFLPAPLVAVAAATALAAILDLPVLYVELPDNLLDEVFLPSLAELQTMIRPGLLLVAAQIAVVASAATLLCATAVDQLHQGPRTRYDRELVAQGVGNMACGLLGAIPMAGLIVRSTANIQAGAKSRWSAVLHGFWLLILVTAAPSVLRLIPTAALAAILVYTGYKLVNLQTIRSLLVYGRSEAGIYVATLVAIVAADLLIGVLVGVALSIVKLLATFSRLKVTLRGAPGGNRMTLLLRGSATFLRLPRLAAVLERVPPGCALHVDFERLSYIDHACLDLLMSWEQQHAATGGSVSIDWEGLTARFTADLPSQQGAAAGPGGSSRARTGRARDMIHTRRGN